MTFCDCCSAVVFTLYRFTAVISTRGRPLLHQPTHIQVHGGIACCYVSQPTGKIEITSNTECVTFVKKLYV